MNGFNPKQAFLFLSGAFGTTGGPTVFCQKHHLALKLPQKNILFFTTTSAVATL
jgi:hypothetical protein